MDNLLWLSTNETAWADGIHFLQIADIDASDTQNWNNGEGFNPIGWREYFDYSNPFRGSYNGSNHFITNLTINNPQNNSLGLFGFIAGAEISNLSLSSVSIHGNSYTGGLVGYSMYSSISNCSVSGAINGYEQVGTLIGRNEESNIDNCEVTANVSGGQSTGGLIGFSDDHSTIANVSADCNVTGTIEVGGIIGISRGNTEIYQCISIGSITGNQNVGGLVGRCFEDATITNSYTSCNVSGLSYTGGLVGCISDYTSIVNCYYNYDNILINNQHAITLGALTSDIYQDWLSNNLTLDVNNYLVLIENYYQINDINDLKALLAFGNNPQYRFMLTQDIDLDSFNGYSIPLLSSELNGNNHTITNYTVISPNSEYCGFIQYALNAQIKNLDLTNSTVTGDENVGVLLGKAEQSTIYNCKVQGIVNGQENVGGLAGSVEDNSNIVFCRSICNVDGDTNIGGLVGKSAYDSSLRSCWSSGQISGLDEVGGLAGLNGFTSTIHNCYSTAEVTGNDNIGGLVGLILENSNVLNSYAIGSVTANVTSGGLVGSVITSYIVNSVWNIETTELLDGVGYQENSTITSLLSCTTLQMQNSLTFTDIGWDFIGENANGSNDLWDIIDDTNSGFPILTLREDPTPIEEITPEYSISEDLLTNYPNPFNPETTIEFNVKKNEKGYLTIFNIKGQVVKEYPEFQDGKHCVVWSGDDKHGKEVASGVYFYRLKTGSYNTVKKMIMMK